MNDLDKRNKLSSFIFKCLNAKLEFVNWLSKSTVKCEIKYRFRYHL